MNNMESFTQENKKEETIESYSSFENIERSLDTLSSNLAAIENLPGYEKDIADLKRSIANVQARINEGKN